EVDDEYWRSGGDGAAVTVATRREPDGTRTGLGSPGILPTPDSPVPEASAGPIRRDVTVSSRDRQPSSDTRPRARPCRSPAPGGRRGRAVRGDGRMGRTAEDLRAGPHGRAPGPRAGADRA